jgi:hypothetical protein
LILCLCVLGGDDQIGKTQCRIVDDAQWYSKKIQQLSLRANTQTYKSTSYILYNLGNERD